MSVSAALVVAQVHRLDEALVAQVFERVVVDVEVVLGHDPEGADGGQRAAVLAVQLVDVVTDHDQLALLAARQVEVAHQALARICRRGPVRRTRALVRRRGPLAVSRASSRASNMASSLLGVAVWVIREGALAVAARGGSGRR